MKYQFLILVSITTILAFGPYDQTQGEVSKLLYLHVPTVWVAYLAYTVTFIYSLRYLISKKPKFDQIAASSAKVGVFFTAITLFAGSLWGRFTWGTWWVWGDARLNLTALLLLVYIGYIVSRGTKSSERHLIAKRSGYIGTLGIVQIPIIHFSVLWWRSVHQPATILSQETASTGSAPMSTDILITLLISVILTTLYYIVDLLRVLKDEQKYWEDDMNKVDREKVSEPVLAEDD
tara:strand:+ start:665 stop:1366 length:702 start_codon:yes stop_codon:yes gene_type:complete